MMSVKSDMENLLGLDSSDQDAEYEFIAFSDDKATTSDHLAVLCHLQFMYNGSISARGYFDGLELQQVHCFLLHLEQEYQRFINKHVSNTGDDISAFSISKGAGPTAPEITTNNTTEPC